MAQRRIKRPPSSPSFPSCIFPWTALGFLGRTAGDEHEIEPDEFRKRRLDETQHGLEKGIQLQLRSGKIGLFHQYAEDEPAGDSKRIALKADGLLEARLANLGQQLGVAIAAEVTDRFVHGGK